MNENNYEIYKKMYDKEEYFQLWSDQNNLKALTEELKDDIYQKYLVKSAVLNRDNFRCQNVDCKNSTSPLTMHHIKFQKNGGEDKVRNGITLCRSCHQGYHRGKREIVFGEFDYLPPHIRGHTLKIVKVVKSDWKKVKKEMRQLRKSLKGMRTALTMNQLTILMKFLTMIYDDDDD
jgi:hypothetical protein